MWLQGPRRDANIGEIPVIVASPRNKGLPYCTTFPLLGNDFIFSFLEVCAFEILFSFWEGLASKKDVGTLDLAPCLWAGGYGPIC